MLIKGLTKFSALALVFSFAITMQGNPLNKDKKRTSETTLAAKIRRFAPTVITANTSGLSRGDRLALAKIIEAARILDPLFLRQVWSGMPRFRKSSNRIRRKRAANACTISISTTARGRALTATSRS